MSNYKFLLYNAFLSERMMHLQDNNEAPRALSTSRMQSAEGKLPLLPLQIIIAFTFRRFSYPPEIYQKEYSYIILFFRE